MSGEGYGKSLKSLWLGRQLVIWGSNLCIVWYMLRYFVVAHHNLLCFHTVL